MLKSQKLTIELSENREKVNALNTKDTLSEAETAELATRTARLQAIEPELRAAIAAEGEAASAAGGGGGDDSEARELRDLEGRASLGAIFAATIEHRATDGPTAELQAHRGLGPNQIPVALLRGSAERREVTPAPGNVATQQDAIIPAVFPMACAAFLGVDMPTVPTGDAVYPVLTTRATVGGPHVDGTVVAETTGAFAADILAPARLQAAFFYRRTDRARFMGLDESLRMNLSDALSDGLDAEVIAGANGLLTGDNLAAHAAAALTTFADYVGNFAYGRVDGRYAAMTGEIRVVMGPSTYGHAGSVYRNNSVDRNALDRLMEVTGGVKVSAHVPAVAAMKQNAIVRLGMRRDMVAPIWEGVTLIPDEVTKASSGEIVLTAVMLHAVKILRADGFHKQETQHPA